MSASPAITTAVFALEGSAVLNVLRRCETRLLVLAENIGGSATVYFYLGRVSPQRTVSNRPCAPRITNAGQGISSRPWRLYPRRRAETSRTFRQAPQLPRALCMH